MIVDRLHDSFPLAVIQCLLDVGRRGAAFPLQQLSPPAVVLRRQPSSFAVDLGEPCLIERHVSYHGVGLVLCVFARPE
ncbi:MAG: hypothetical protein HY873_00300 [Chloroflexi bacterium]|nr:hypothetical protein [Chloroflexota bacterium]